MTLFTALRPSFERDKLGIQDVIRCNTYLVGYQRYLTNDTYLNLVERDDQTKIGNIL